MADVFVRRRSSQTRSRERHFGEIPLSSGEIEYFSRQDEATRRRQRLLHVREQEKRAAQLVTQRYRDNLRKLQSYKLQLAQRDHRQQQDTVLSALHEKYQYSLQGMGTAQRNAREKMIELMELAQLEQGKWSANRRGEKLRFQDAVEIKQEDASVRLARRREIERNLKRLKEMSLKHRSEASARARRELEQELKLQKAQEDAQRYRAQHLEAEEFSFPRKTPKDVTAYQFTRTHCVAVPGSGARSGNGSKSTEPATQPSTFREVKVIRHNRNTQQTATSAIDQAEVYRKEMELKQESEWRLREQQAKVAGTRGQDALQTAESIHEGTRALEWLIELERQARVEKATQLEADVVKNEPRRDGMQHVDDSGSEAFARMFGIEEGSEGLLDDSFGGPEARLDGQPERIAARRAGSVSASDESWLLEDEWRTPSEAFDAEEHEIPPVQRAPEERMIDQKIETMNELLKRVASYGESQPVEREEEASERDTAQDNERDEAVRRSSRERYDEWRVSQGLDNRPAFDEGPDLARGTGRVEESASQGTHDAASVRSTDSAELGRDRSQWQTNSSLQQDRRSQQLVNDGIANPATSEQAQVTSEDGESDHEAAAPSARQRTFATRHTQELFGSEAFQSETAERRARESNAGRGHGGELGDSRQRANLSRRDQWQGGIRRSEEQSTWLDERSARRAARRDHHRSRDLDEESDEGSHDYDAGSRQESIDELEERLQQVLQERKSSRLGQNERYRAGDKRHRLRSDRDLPQAADPSEVHPLSSDPGDRHVERASRSSGQVSTSSRRGIGSQSSWAGEVRGNAHHERGNRFVANDEREIDASDGEMNDDHRSVNPNRLQSRPTVSHESSDDEVSGNDARVDSTANGSGHHNLDFRGAHNAGVAKGPSAANSLTTQPAQQRQDGRTRGNESITALEREEENAGEEYQVTGFTTQASTGSRKQSTTGAALTENEAKSGRSSRDRRPTRDDLTAHQLDADGITHVHADARRLSDAEIPGHDLRGDSDQDVDDRERELDQAAGPSAVVALDDSADTSDFESSMLFTGEVAQPGGIASYVRQMQQDGLTMQSSSSSFPQYSLPLSDSFSSMNDSIVEADAGVATLTNQLLPMFPRQLRRVSDMSATTDEFGVQTTSRQQRARRGSARGEAAILVKGLAQQDTEGTEAAAEEGNNVPLEITPVNTQVQDRRGETAQQDISRLQHHGAPANDSQPRGPLHDLSFSSDSSSDMSALMYLTRMRKVASTGTAGSRNSENKDAQAVSSSSDSLSGLSSLSSTPVHPSIRNPPRSQTQQAQVAHDTRRDSVGSASSSTPSIDARFQYLVNMTAVAGKALPLHMNLPPKDFSRGDMRFPPPQVKLNVYASSSDDDDDGVSHVDDQHAEDHLSASIEQVERRDSSLGGKPAAGRTQYPLPAAPFGQLDLSNPPAPAFGSSSYSASASEVSSGSSRSGRGARRSHWSRRDDEPVQLALEELSERLAGLPPPPFGSFNMSQPPDPIGWGHDGDSDDDGSSAVVSEANASRFADDSKDVNDVDDGVSNAEAQPSESAQVTGASLRKKGEALFVPIEPSQGDASTTTGSLADAFRQRHPNFQRRAQEANKSLLEQRREQLAARRAEPTASASTSQLQQPSMRVQPKAPLSPARSRTPSTMSMPPPALLDRLATGERAKISAQEMKDRTRRLYSQLPEVAERKRQEDVLERRRQRLAEMREREKLRRQQQRQR